MPFELVNAFSEGAAGVGIPEGILASLMRAINILQGTDYSCFSISGNVIFTNIYSILRIVSAIVMIACTAMFIIGLLSGSLNRFKLRFLCKRPTYIFFDHNEKSFAIAESIRQGSSVNRNGKKQIKIQQRKK